MKKIGIKWKGPLLSPSGYGTANRDYVQAIYDNLDVEICTHPRQNDTKNPESFGQQGILINELSKKDIDYDLVVHHHVPSIQATYTDPGKINVGYSTWETDILPEAWVWNINNNFDLQLVPSQFNKEVYTQSGVQIPIKVLPHCVDVNEFINSHAMNLPLLEDKFKFLSVFQWTERKNPIGLLKAYFSTFYDRDDVVLILKTYRSNTSTEQQSIIRREINHLKNEMKLKNYPPIYFIGTMFDRESMISLYNACDCFVLPTRAEGFGIPFAEALAGKNFVIAPNYSGHVDFLKSANEKCCFLTNYQMTPVAHMTWIPNYDARMSWAEPDIKETGFFMKHVSDALDNNMLENKKQMAREHVQKTLSPKVIANQFASILEEYFQ